MRSQEKKMGMDVARLREVNSSVVLDVLRARGKMGRREIAKLTGLSFATVCRLANELLERSIITEVDAVKLNGAKRKTTLLDVNPDGGWVVALSVSGSRVKAAAMDLLGVLGEPVEQQLEYVSGEAYVTPAILSVLSSVIETQRPTRSNPLAIGISLSGIVDDEQGIVRVSFHLQLRDYPIARIVREFCDVPILLRNDVMCSTLAELRFGHGRYNRDFAYVMVDTGVGAGLVFDGEVRRFPLGAEFGLMVVAPEGDPERFSGRGYLESLSSGWGIAAAAGVQMESGNAAILSKLVPGGPALVTAKSVVEAALIGDQTCRDILAQAANYLGVGVVNHAHTLGLKLIVVAGGLVDAEEHFWGPLRKSVEKHEYWSGMIRVEPSLLECDATLLGAGLLALDNAFSGLGAGIGPRPVSD
ncbi:MAG: ROK family transcriptional regulator [Armatimonadota bacterium]